MATAQEIEADYLRRMGPELGSQFARLYHELVWLHAVWSEFEVLFSTRESVELLNGTAPNFFRITQDALWESALLHICRLTDRVTIAGRSNLTLRALAVLVNSEIRSVVEQKTTLLIDASEFARDWRNRHIAHRDLGLALNRNAAPLAAANRVKVRDVLRLMSELLNFIDAQYAGPAVMYEIGNLPSGAGALLVLLRNAIASERHRREWLEGQRVDRAGNDDHS